MTRLVLILLLLTEACSTQKRHGIKLDRTWHFDSTITVTDSFHMVFRQDSTGKDSVTIRTRHSSTQYTNPLRSDKTRSILAIIGASLVTITLIIRYLLIK